MRKKNCHLIRLSLTIIKCDQTNDEKVRKAPNINLVFVVVVVGFNNFQCQIVKLKDTFYLLLMSSLNDDDDDDEKKIKLN